ncbi:MAG: hypothetical protein E6G97_10430 [Alphaproteobacteria bacterium]|nr:MAG: hypothetical protein E6G97_10430 [Alphaproteobacteria bacterium]
MRAILAAATLIATAMTAIVPAHAADNFTSGNWRGGAVFEGTKFVQCNMWAPDLNNWDLMFAMTQSGDFRMGLRNRKIDMTWAKLFGQKLAVRMQIDDNPVIITAFTAASATVASTSIANLGWDKALRAGKTLRVHTGKGVRRFPLAGIDPALAQLSACAAKHRRA